MLVVFQNKIIYMPSVPPFSRSERIKDYEAQCRPLHWQERRTRAADGVDLALAVSSVTGNKPTISEIQKHIVVIYFQGSVCMLPVSEVCRALKIAPVTVALCPHAFLPFPHCSKHCNEMSLFRPPTLL